jgi:hypothetical protein
VKYEDLPDIERETTELPADNAPSDPQSIKRPSVPAEPCPQCGGRQYWRAKIGPFICYDCTLDKPSHNSVEEWWYLVP